MRMKIKTDKTFCAFYRLGINKISDKNTEKNT